MTTTKRCTCCGKIMQKVTLGEDAVLQCPRCKYCEQLQTEKATEEQKN